jgi:prevent-host-death family protein
MVLMIIILKWIMEFIMNTITANQLKTKGVSVIENNLAENHELVITVRGKEKFVVMDMKKYNYLRECELETALHQTEADYHDGNFVAESVEDHIKRITH